MFIPRADSKKGTKSNKFPKPERKAIGHTISQSTKFGNTKILSLIRITAGVGILAIPANIDYADINSSIDNTLFSDSFLIYDAIVILTF